MGICIGIDIGATTIKIGLINESKVIIRNEVKTPRDNKNFKQCILKLVSDFTSYSKKRYNKIPKYIGIASPGPSDYKHYIINVNNANIKRINLKELLNPFSKNIYVSNDASVFTLYHSILGLGSNYRIVAGVTLGTGIGGGLVIDRVIYSGKGNAIEIGHISYDQNNDFEKEYQRILKNGVKKLNLKCVGDLYLKAKENNKTAIETFNNLGTLIGKLIINISNAYDPEIIIFGGKVSNSWRFLKDNIIKIVKEKSIIKPPRLIKNNVSYAGILGASLLNKQK